MSEWDLSMVFWGKLPLCSCVSTFQFILIIFNV